MSQYPPGGVLFTNDKKQGKQPDYRGNIEIDRALYEEIGAQLQANERATLDLAGWRRTSRTGKDFISLKPDKPFKKDQGNNSQSSQGNYQAPPRGDIDDEIPF